MYRIVKQNVFCLFISLFCFSCNHKNKDILLQAEKLVELNPDTALSILKAIDFPQNLELEDYANYLLLYTELKDKAGISITKDSLIYIPVEYFQKRKDNYRAALACFYCNRFYYQQDNHEKAMLYLLLSKDYAKKSKNYNLLGLIHYDLGNLYEDEFNNKMALLNYKKSNEYFVKSGNEKNATYSLKFIGNIYIKQDPQLTDSAFYYYDKVLNYAKLHNDTAQIISTLKNIGVTYCETGDYVNTKHYLLQCMEVDKNKHFFIPVCNLLSNVYLSLNLSDSAIYYATQISPDIIENNDWVSLYNYYYLMSSIYDNAADYKQALEYYKTSNYYITSIYEDKINHSILDIQEKYHSEKLKNSLQKAKFQQSLLTVIGLLALVITIFLVYFFRHKMNKKQEKIYQIEQNLEIMNEMLTKGNENNNVLKNLLLEKLDMAKKVAQISVTSLNKNKDNLKDIYFKAFGESISKALDWNNLYPIIDNLSDGFAKKLKEKHPNLSEKEAQFCCLLRVNFKFDEITAILGYDNILSAHSQKNKLRVKMGFSGMKDFLNYIHTL